MTSPVYRVAAALALVLVPALASAALSLADALRFDETYRHNDEVAFYDGPRLANVKRLLRPPARVGFLEDAYPPGESWPKPYVAQYVLAPVVVVNDAAMPVVLVNFRDAEAIPRTPPGIRYHLLADCGGGVRLYRVTIE